jgi:hypothetical protein
MRVSKKWRIVGNLVTRPRTKAKDNRERTTDIKTLAKEAE